MSAPSSDRRSWGALGVGAAACAACCAAPVVGFVGALSVAGALALSGVLVAVAVAALVLTVGLLRRRRRRGACARPVGATAVTLRPAAGRQQRRAG